MRTVRTLSLLLVGVLALTAVDFALPAPVEARGSSCTGWTSRMKEPNFVRVLNTRTGVVHKVRFKRYVAQVMASGEWPSHLRFAVLVAGAQATKQYAWYYTLRGHWRGGISRGRCYDVVNNTNDQLWHPGVKPARKQLRAVNAVWGLSLWKIRKGHDRFFLTGYRAGYSRACARDANGWKLYARSASTCARKGWSGERILRKYFSNTVHRQSKRTRDRKGSRKPTAAVFDQAKITHAVSGSPPGQTTLVSPEELAALVGNVIDFTVQVLRGPIPSSDGGYVMNRAVPV